MAASALTLSAGITVAAPLTLEGMGMQKQWLDTEAAAGEMPGFVWGNSDTMLADSIGLHVLFEDGTEGSIAYSGVAAHWNTNGAAFGSLISASGFFADYTGLHYLYNSAPTTVYPEALPIAWNGNPVTPFGNNVELDHNEQNGSQFRISTPGWTSVEITTYSSSAIAATVPLPASGLLIVGGLAGLGAMRRKKKAA